MWDNKEKIGFENYSVANKRTFMMINFLYYTLCRFDDLKSIKCKHLNYENDIFTIHVSKSKTDQGGRGQKVYLPHKKNRSPHRLLCEYMQIFKLQANDYLFSPLKWNKTVKIWDIQKEKAISYSAAYTNFKSYLKFCNIDNKGLSLHSPRIGAMVDLFESRAPDHLIDKRGRWKSTQTKHIYNQPTEDSLKKLIIDHY